MKINEVLLEAGFGSMLKGLGKGVGKVAGAVAKGVGQAFTPHTMADYNTKHRGTSKNTHSLQTAGSLLQNQAHELYGNWTDMFRDQLMPTALPAITTSVNRFLHVSSIPPSFGMINPPPQFKTNQKDTNGNYVISLALHANTPADIEKYIASVLLYGTQKHAEKEASAYSRTPTWDADEQVALKIIPSGSANIGKILLLNLDPPTIKLSGTSETYTRDRMTVRWRNSKTGANADSATKQNEYLNAQFAIIQMTADQLQQVKNKLEGRSNRRGGKVAGQVSQTQSAEYQRRRRAQARARPIPTTINPTVTP